MSKNGRSTSSHATASWSHRLRAPDRERTMECRPGDARLNDKAWTGAPVTAIREHTTVGVKRGGTAGETRPGSSGRFFVALRLPDPIVDLSRQGQHDGDR